MIILGLETSCDETACSILEHKNGKFFVLSNIISSQIKLHSKWGGVVPNLAAREHLKNIIPVINTALKEAKIKPKAIDLISVTKGPGLIPALLIGTCTAKTLSYLWGKPLLGIHHIEGHIYANLLSNKKITFPVLCLVVSGGHTQLVLMKKHLNYEVVGETLDDAAGEAFDKVARILNLGYPGGPAIAKKASELKTKNEKLKISLPRPMINSTNFNFSFSGLKTAVLYLVKKNNPLLKNKDFVNEVCHEFQQAVVDVLIQKTLRTAKKYSPKTIMLAGGVSANKELRQQLGKAIKKDFKSISYIIPDVSYSLDNAVMIAIAGFYRWKKEKDKDNWKKLKTEANLKIT